MSKFLGITPTLGSGSSFGLGSGLPPSGPVPVISLATPNVSSAAGGWNITLTGNGFTGATAVKIAGVTATSIVIVNDTTITCNAPAFSTPNGTSVAQTISVKTSNGTGTSTSFYYYPSNQTLRAAYRGDVGTTVSTGIIIQWNDLSGNANNLVRGGGHQGPAPTVVNGLGAAAFTTGVGMHLGATPGFTSGFATMIGVCSAASYAASTLIYLLSSSGFEMGLAGLTNGGNVWNLTDAVVTNIGLNVTGYNTSQFYSVVGLNNGPTNSARYVNNDDTGATGSQGALTAITDFSVGYSLATDSDSMVGTICEVLLYEGACSSADLTTIYNIQKTIWAIP